MGFKTARAEYAPPGFGIKAKHYTVAQPMPTEYAPPGFGIKAKLDRESECGYV